MGRTNQTSLHRPKTFEGGVANKIPPIVALRNSVMACMLWEDTFYEEGESIVTRIMKLIDQCAKDHAEQIASMAKTARDSGLRHAPLLIVLGMVRSRHTRPLVADTLAYVIQRPDEITEFLSLYWKDGRIPIAAQVKKGLSKAFNKFDEYQLAKYNRQSDEIKLRDALFLCHAKPMNEEKEKLFKKVAEDTMSIPNTWETRLSSGEDKAKVFTDLIESNRLGQLAFLRNLRGMREAGIAESSIRSAFAALRPTKVFPYQYIIASKYAEFMAKELEDQMLRSARLFDPIPDDVAIMVDVSGSMMSPLSVRSQANRIDAAASLAIMCRECCTNAGIYRFATSFDRVSNLTGFGLYKELCRGGIGYGTNISGAIDTAKKEGFRNFIVVTDMQIHDHLPGIPGWGFMLNVGPYGDKSIGYGTWNQITGFSNYTFDFIRELFYSP